MLASNPFAIFSQKPIQKEQNSFSTIAYKTILDQCKQYHFKWVAVHADVVELNKLLYALHYLDLGAVQVFKTQQRTADLKTVQQLSCTIKKNQYSHWFLDLKSFFAQYAKRLALVKNTFIAIQHGSDLFEKVPYAQPYVLVDLKDNVALIDKELETKQAQQKQDTQKSIAEVINAQKQKIKELNSEIEKEYQTIKQLQEQVQKTNQDTLDWETDLNLVNEITQTSKTVSVKQEELRELFEKTIQNIAEQKINLGNDLDKVNQQKLNYENIVSKKNNLEQLINRISVYNDKMAKSDWLFFEPSDVSSERLNIIKEVNELKIPELDKTQILDTEKKFSPAYINILIDYENDISIDYKIEVITKTIDQLQNQIKALNQQERDAENKMYNDLKEAQEILNQYTGKFKHNEILHRNSNETQNIQNKINENNKHIIMLNQLIESSKKKIEDLKEKKVNFKNVIEKTNEESPRIMKTVEERLLAEKNNRLKAIPYVEHAQSYLNSILSKDKKQDLVTNALLLHVAQAVGTILYNLELIFTIPPLKKDISMASLQSDYTEKLGLLDTLKYKAADVQQEVVDRFVAFKKAFGQVTQQKSATPVQKEKKGAQQENIYCTFDNSLIDNIQAKTVALKEDVQAMLNHTLTLAQSVEDDYKKLIVIQDILFVPLCKAYEKLELITNPWLNGHEQSHNEPFDLKALKIAYSALLQSEQQLSTAIIDHKDTLIIAEYFFMQVGKDLLQRVQDSKINAAEKNNDQWFEYTFNTIRAYEFALKHINSTQMRWYSFSKESKKRLWDLFDQLKTALLNKKIELAMVLLSTKEQLQERSEEKINDLFINDKNNIDGRLISTIDRIMIVQHTFIQLAHVFTSKNKSKNTVVSSLKSNVQRIINHMIVQKTNLSNSLVDQVTKPLYDAVIAQGKQLLLVLPDDVKISTNPFDQIVKV